MARHDYGFSKRTCEVPWKAFTAPLWTHISTIASVPRREGGPDSTRCGESKKAIPNCGKSSRKCLATVAPLVAKTENSWPPGSTRAGRTPKIPATMWRYSQPKPASTANPMPRARCWPRVGNTTMLKLSRLDAKHHPGWTLVEADAKSAGYIRNHLIHGGLDFRAVFENKKGNG